MTKTSTSTYTSHPRLSPTPNIQVSQTPYAPQQPLHQTYFLVFQSKFPIFTHVSLIEDLPKVSKLRDLLVN